jgi:hypothetical protein
MLPAIQLQPDEARQQFGDAAVTKMARRHLSALPPSLAVRDYWVNCPYFSRSRPSTSRKKPTM